MAEIRFQLLKQANGTPAIDTFSGSGLAFYGATAGASVQIGSYQDVTTIANSDGSTNSDATNNLKYVTSVFPSGRCTLGGAFAGSDTNIGLSGVKTMHGTLGIEFGHTSAVKAQNCQLRIFDRNNVNFPASGVNTKVAEIVNHNGSTFNNQGSTSVTSNAVGSGDALWWGEPWPNALVTNSFVNSSAVTFTNGYDNSSVVNGDSRLATAGVAGSYDTVGGTGIIVPLLDSPGSGQKGLQNNQVVSGTGMVWPKWTQYLKTTGNQQTFFGSTAHQFGDGSSSKQLNYGGTGVDTHHTWSVALSASPLSTGSKESYGLYFSLEYL
tara:strand:- start:60325 stop:61293 length:969 start_codon:yes stop_codon:yes gene_type:complete